MARRVHSDGSVLTWGPNGAVFVTRLAPGVLYTVGIGNFDGPFEDGPMCDFDREIAAHGSVDMFMDLRNVERGSRKSRDPWKEWATKNRTRVRSHLLVRSSILRMAISVISMVSGAISLSYDDDKAFLRELTRKVPGVRNLPAVPGWALALLDKGVAARSG
jgi:hypothetical protein